jgi:hypothetical protein
MAGADTAEDRHQLVVGVVRKDDGLFESGRQSRVGGEELGHQIGVAGGDDGDVASVLHELVEHVDRLATERVLVAPPCQGVGLVDEQHPTGRRLEGLGRLGGGLALVLGDEMGA